MKYCGSVRNVSLLASVKRKNYKTAKLPNYKTTKNSTNKLAILALLFKFKISSVLSYVDSVCLINFCKSPFFPKVPSVIFD